MTHPALLEQAALELRRAVVLPGPQPQWHRSVIARHRAEWPKLWAAIDSIIASLEQPAPDDPTDPGPVESMMRRAIAEGLGDQHVGYGDSSDELELDGAFEVERDPALRCGADVAGFRCTRSLGHFGRHWSSSTAGGFDDVRGDGLNGE